MGRVINRVRTYGPEIDDCLGPTTSFPLFQKLFRLQIDTNKRAASQRSFRLIIILLMSALRWLNASRSLALFGARRNIALASSEATNVTPPPQITTPTAPNAVQAGRQQRGRRRRRRKIEIRRPSISTETPRKWNRPLAEGVLPAYDLALQLIQKDGNGLKLEARALQAEIDTAETKIQSMFAESDAGKEGVLEAMDREIENMRKRLHILEVQSEVNLPSMRWKVANAMGA